MIDVTALSRMHACSSWNVSKQGDQSQLHRSDENKKSSRILCGKQLGSKHPTNHLP
jgi:hypothetical protein